MISAKDELLHLVECFDNEECEAALELLEPLLEQSDSDLWLTPGEAGIMAAKVEAAEADREPPPLVVEAK